MEHKVAHQRVFSTIGYTVAVFFWFSFLPLLLGFLRTPREGGTEYIYSVINVIYNHPQLSPWFVLGWWFSIGFIILTHRLFPSWKVVLKWLTIGMVGFLSPLIFYLVWM